MIKHWLCFYIVSFPPAITHNSGFRLYFASVFCWALTLQLFWARCLSTWSSVCYVFFSRVSLEDLYNGKSSKVDVERQIICAKCQGWVINFTEYSNSWLCLWSCDEESLLGFFEGEIAIALSFGAENSRVRSSGFQILVCFSLKMDELLQSG